MTVSLWVTESALLYTQQTLFTPDCAISNYLLAYCMQDYKHKLVICTEAKGSKVSLETLSLCVCKPGFAKLRVGYKQVGE